MSNNKTKELLQFTSWPVDCLLNRPGGQTVGFLMPRVPGKPIHNLYTPKSRLKEFPKATWSFLILAARNLAACFDTIHRHGHVVGDVNHGNAFINDDARVWLIDCDSFQVNLGGTEHRCHVGVDTHTPPELQGLTLKDVTRTPNHDNFGLAVLIFQLLFMGRHPFSGRFLGNGDLTIAKAISEYRFAFGSGASGRLMEQPPNTLALDKASKEIEQLFQRAFLRPTRDTLRPVPMDWITHLDRLARSLRTCRRQASHEYHSALSSCPWCGIEENTGATLFCQPNSGVKQTSQASPWAAISAVKAPSPLSPFPDPGVKTVAPSQKANELRERSRGSLFSKLKAWMRFDSRVNQEVKELKAELVVIKKDIAALKEQWKAEASEHLFATKRGELEEFHRQFLAIPQKYAAKVNELHENQRRLALMRHLESHLVQDAFIDGIGPVLKNTLIYYGIRDADDVKRKSNTHIPGFGPVRWSSLRAWASVVEGRFKFDPTRHVDPAGIRALEIQKKNDAAALERILVIGAAELKSLGVRIELARQKISQNLGPLLVRRDQLLSDISHLQRL